jgi:large-conductance mechanosensitive channel
MSFSSLLNNEQTKFTIFATVLGSGVVELLHSLSSHILIPLIDGDCNKDGEQDIKNNLKNKTYTINKKIIYVGEFMYIFIKFTIFFIILFIMYILTSPHSLKV